MRKLIPLLILLLSVSAPVAARMYQWVDSDTGNVRMSGDPPPWYRNGRNGPRVLVFENGRLIDDTAVPLSPEQRKAVRETAFHDADLRREQEAVRMLERAALREARRREESNRPEAGQPVTPDSTTTEAPPPEDDRASPPADAPEAAMVEQLKALLSEWDQQQGLERQSDQKP